MNATAQATNPRPRVPAPVQYGGRNEFGARPNCDFSLQPRRLDAHLLAPEGPATVPKNPVPFVSSANAEKGGGNGGNGKKKSEVKPEPLAKADGQTAAMPSPSPYLVGGHELGVKERVMF